MRNTSANWLPDSGLERSQRERERATMLRSRLELLANSGRALDLRMARLLAWIKGRDLAPLGFPTFRSFCIEHVDWGASWLGQLIRLTEADLPRIMAAVCTGQLPLSKAVRAPRETDRVGEAAWLEQVLDGSLPWWERDGNLGPSMTIIGPDADRARDTSGARAG